MKPKLTQEERRTIYILYCVGFKQADLARKYDVSPSNISQLIDQYNKQMQETASIIEDIDRLQAKIQAEAIKLTGEQKDAR